MFERIHEPESWVALCNIETHPVYAALLHQIIDAVRSEIEREARHLPGNGLYLPVGATLHHAVSH
ncbi:MULTISPECIES: hypothetical protein [unclassified Variovorax]|uniref:hypothetical protein n=1 Tax=unclassified Variovorax TaxID=663243 RepID=UPI0011603906|nr:MULTISPECIES: hypothetical protein [unclassified Variovorax]